LISSETFNYFLWVFYKGGICADYIPYKAAAELIFNLPPPSINSDSQICCLA
jgi:hypothetical protein